MTGQNYEQIKEEIANGYLKKFKEELGWFKSLTVLPIENKLKKIMISDNDLEGKTLNDLEDLGRWRNVLGTITPSIANDIFDFLKEKQSLIVQAETAKQLDTLKNEVVLGKIVESAQDTETTNVPETDSVMDNKEESTGEIQSDETENDQSIVGNKEEKKQRNSIASGVAVGVTGATAWKVMEKNVNKYNNMKLKKNLDFEVSSASAKQEIGKVQRKIDDMVKYVDDAKRNPKISRAVRKNLEKSSKKFAEMSGSLADEGVISAWDARGKLGRDMPAELLDAVDPKTAKLLSELDDDILKRIAKAKNTDEIAEILGKHGIKNIDKKVLSVLTEMDDIANIRAFSRVLRHGKKLSPILKGLSCFGALDMLFFGFDIWMWNESMNEVDFIAKVNEARASVKNERANFELLMGAASIVIELGIIITCSSMGTAAGSIVPGLGNAVGFVIGVVVGVLIFTIQDMVNQLYYDKLEFYTQNREDYIRQERTGIKQAILQCAKEQNIDGNPNLTDTALNDKGINTFQDAWEALIFQEEMRKYEDGQLPAGTKFSLIANRYYSGGIKSEYMAGLNEEDKIEWDKERKVMNTRIGKRMEYVKYFITKEGGAEKYERFMENIKANAGLSYIEKIVGESDIYMEINQENNEYLPGFTGTVDEYKDALGLSIKEKYPDEFELFENIFKNDIYQFEYICTGAEVFLLHEDIYTTEEYDAIKKNKEFIHLFYHYKKVGVSIENTRNVTIDYTDYDYNYLERLLIDFDEIEKRSNFNKKNVIDYFSSQTGIESRLATHFQVSSSTGQNIIYRMAREFHGYGGNNDMFELMSFYNEGSDKTKGIYYDNEWMVNNDENTFGGDRRYNESMFGIISGGIIPSAIANWFSTIDRSRDLDAIDKENMTSDEVYDKFDDVLMLDSKVDVADREAVEEFRAEIKKIIEEEIAAKSPEKKKNIEKELEEFIKTQSISMGESSEIAEDGSLIYSGNETAGYVEIPYELVIAAKRAKIGDVENFLFKYEEGKIVAVSSQQYVDTPLLFDTFDVSYERVTPLRDELTQEELVVVGKVDAVKARLSRLRSVESARDDELFGGLEDELNIPVEVEREMTKKVYERESIKESLLYLDINEANSKLLKQWKQYYDYFNDTYIGMLATISQFSMNNNLGSFNRMSQAWTWIGREKYKIDEKGEITIDHLDLEDDEKEFILEYIKKSYQGENKTVEELLKSDDEAERQKGQWMLDQIMVAVFESEVLHMDPTGKRIVMINQQKDSRSKEVELNVEKYLGSSVTYVSVIDTLTSRDGGEIQTNEQTIQVVSDIEKNTYNTINTTLSTIIDTMNNVDRGHGRKKIKFLVNDKESTDEKIVGIVQSRGTKHEVIIDIQKKTYKIEGLEYIFTNEEEFAYTINFTNRVEGYYLKDNPEMKGRFFFGDFMYPNTLFADRNRNPNDVDILRSDAITSKFSWISKGNDGNREKFLTYINSLGSIGDPAKKAAKRAQGTKKGKTAA